MSAAFVTLLLDDYLSNALSLMHLSFGTKQLSQECEDVSLQSDPILRGRWATAASLYGEVFLL